MTIEVKIETRKIKGGLITEVYVNGVLYEEFISKTKAGVMRTAGKLAADAIYIMGNSPEPLEDQN